MTKSKKNIIAAMSVIALTFTAAGFSGNIAYASECIQVKEEAVTEGIIETRSAIIEYRYKVIDGKLYRRLYNYTEQCWVGEWELVAE